MKEKNDKMINFRCSGELWDQFSSLAKSQNTTASSLLKELMINALGDYPSSAFKNERSAAISDAIEEKIQKYYTQTIAYLNDIDERLRIVEKSVNTNVNTDANTDVPTDVPTDVFTSVVNTNVPTDVPTDVPTEPTDIPTDVPTDVNTDVNTDVPTELTDVPTDVPTDANAEISTDVIADLHTIDKLGLRAIANGEPYNQASLIKAGVYKIIDDNRYLLIREGIKYKHESIGMVHELLTYFGYKIITKQIKGVRYKQVELMGSDTVYPSTNS